MEIKKLLQQSRDIWGDENLPLAQMVVRLVKVLGDISKWERNSKKDVDTHTAEELKKEFGNLIFTSIQFCDELGFDPEECINLAVESQKSLVLHINK